MKHTPKLAALLASSLTLLMSPEVSQAFSGGETFGKPPEMGGGGGRYFTASIFDGYGCSVCHRGGTPPNVQINGLPVNGYQPGTTYNIELTWTNPAIPVGLQLEIVGRDGRVPGQVVLPDEASTDVRDRCGGIPTGKVASYEIPVGTRKVLGVEPCRAQSLHFRFTPANVADLAFSMSAVTSNNQADLEGDGVTTVRKVLRRVGEPAKTGDCAIAPALGARTGWASGVLALSAALVFLRRALRRRR